MPMHDATGRPGTPAVRRDRRHTGGVFWLALLASALVHALILFGISFRQNSEPRVASRVSHVVHIAPAMQAYDIVEVAYDAPAIEVQVIERAPLRPQPVRAVPPQAEARRDAGADGEPIAERVDPRTVRERLRYHLTTPQVWRAPAEDVAVELTPQEIVEQRIASTLGEFNDSVAAEAAAAARALDWTAKDADGGRWGVSPEGIHLGSITIPLGNSQFAVAPGRREEFAGRVRTWNELQDQAVREEAKGEFKDRVRAIEERMNRERAARGAGSTPAPAPADTARGGGRSN